MHTATQPKTISTPELLKRPGWTPFKVAQALTGRGELVLADGFGPPRRVYDLADVEAVEQAEEWEPWFSRWEARQKRFPKSELVQVDIRDKSTRLFIQRRRAKWMRATKSWLVPGRHVAEARARAAAFDPAESTRHSFRK